jgi:proteasome lid subunit RPN8/RPN11
VRPTRGRRVDVAFDGRWVLGREERRGDVVGFYHTHPDGPTTPSDRDLRTMRAWVGSFGKPMLCIIECGGLPTAYRFDDDRSSGVRLQACERLPGNIVTANDSKKRKKT